VGFQTISLDFLSTFEVTVDTFKTAQMILDYGTSEVFAVKEKDIYEKNVQICQIVGS
jgi:hypothetical protein